ncbi:phosphoglycerol transferase MdoB-like AlkP superfamily enzyme [Puniceicoccus vermicola]
MNKKIFGETFLFLLWSMILFFITLSFSSAHIKISGINLYLVIYLIAFSLVTTLGVVAFSKRKNATGFFLILIQFLMTVFSYASIPSFVATPY